MWKCLCPPPPIVFFFFYSFLAVLGCQAILVSNRNKSFRRGSVGQPLSSTKSSRIRSQRPLSLQPAGLGEIYCERRKKVVISWHFHDETWPKLCWLGGLEAHKEWACVWPSPSQSRHHHWLTHQRHQQHQQHPTRIISPSAWATLGSPPDPSPWARLGSTMRPSHPWGRGTAALISSPTTHPPPPPPSVFCIEDTKGAEVNEKLADLNPSCSV